jgi:hypothetical protein
MGLLTNLWKLIGPTFPNGFCPQTFQELSDAIINGSQVTFLIDTGNFLYNYGSATPAPENRIFPWFNTTFNRWYNFAFGLWVSPMDPSSRESSFRKMWKPDDGTLESSLWALDGGDGTDPGTSPPTATTGAAWQVDHDFDGVFPVGVGTIPGSTDAIALGAQGGEYKHTLTEAEGAVGNHVHAIGQSDTSLTDAAAGFNIGALTTTTAFNAWRVGAGGGAILPYPLTQADLYTLKADNGNGITSTPFSIYPKYKAIWWIKPTSKTYYTLPA